MAEEAEGIRVGTASRGRSKTKDRSAESLLDLFGRNKTSLSLHKPPSEVSKNLLSTSFQAMIFMLLKGECSSTWINSFLF